MKEVSKLTKLDVNDTSEMPEDSYIYIYRDINKMWLSKLISKIMRWPSYKKVFYKVESVDSATTLTISGGDN